MQLLFKQRMFSWFDSYDIYDADKNTVFTVKGQPAWGHLLKIFDSNGNEVGTVRQRLFRFLPAFELYEKDRYLGCVKKEFTLLTPRFNIDFNGWRIEGNWLEWDYTVIDGTDRTVATVSKQIFNWTDTYTIDVIDPSNALHAVMLVLAIDAEKCSRNND